MGAQSKPGAGARFITVQAAAELLSLSASGVRKLVGRGALPSCRVGRAVRIDVRKLELQLEDQAQKTAGKGRRGRCEKKPT